MGIFSTTDRPSNHGCAESRALLSNHDHAKQPKPDPAECIGEVIRSRRSVRRYNGVEIDRGVLLQLLEAAVFAPSPHNRQPWRFAILTAREPKVRLAETMGSKLRSDLHRDGIPEITIEADVRRSVSRISEAPAIILIALSMAQMDRYNDTARQQAEYLMAVQATAAAIQNILLTAHVHGLGGAWMCAPLFCPALVSDVLDLPHDWEPQALLTIGYPAKPSNARPRMPIEEVVKWIG